MEVTVSLIGQMATFILFIWFVKRVVWPVLTKILSDRQQRIADGLAAADQGKLELSQAKISVDQQIRDAKRHAADILEQANKRAEQLLEEAKLKGRKEGERLVTAAHQEIDQMIREAKKSLAQKVSSLALQAAEQVLGESVTGQVDQRIIAQFISEI